VGDLANVPGEMTGKPSWGVWRWTPREGGEGFSKPPYQARRPQALASTRTPGEWCTLKIARKVVDAGRADGVSFNLLRSGLAALDLDHCRDALGQLDDWAANIVAQAERLGAYVEITPSGTGLRVIGRATGADTNRKFLIPGATEGAAAEIFRNVAKAITVTGARLPGIKVGSDLPNIDRLVDDTVARLEAMPKPAPKGNGAAYVSDHRGDIDYEAIVRDGAPDGEDRSSWFNRCVWHFAGTGLGVTEIVAAFEAHPGGVADRYIAQDRLDREVERCFTKWQRENPGADSQRADPGANSQGPHKKAPTLPPMFMHGDVDPLTSRSWLVKNLFLDVGTGLLAGQWGTFKTFMLLELAAAVMTGTPFIDRFRIKRQSGVMLVAAEGAAEVPLRLEAVVREKCGIERAPFVWYEKTPLLLQTGAVETLVGMAQQADRRLREQFELPLGLIIIDTLIIASGYTKPGDENDSAIGQKVMSALKAIAERTRTFVLGVDHFGKNIETGTRGTSVKETDADCVLALLGKEEDGRVTDPRLNTRKIRGARSGEEFPFTVRPVELGTDDDGDPLRTLVIEWQPRMAGTIKDWPKALRLLQRVLVETISASGVNLPIGDGIKVRAVDLEAARARFYELYPAHGDIETKRQHARKTAFLRMIKNAQTGGLLDVQVVGEITFLWVRE
jgi:hypothetical protein